MPTASRLNAFISATANVRSEISVSSKIVEVCYQRLVGRIGRGGFGDVGQGFGPGEGGAFALGESIAYTPAGQAIDHGIVEAALA